MADMKKIVLFLYANLSVGITEVAEREFEPKIWKTKFSDSNIIIIRI